MITITLESILAIATCLIGMILAAIWHIRLLKVQPRPVRKIIAIWIIFTFVAPGLAYSGTAISTGMYVSHQKELEKQKLAVERQAKAQRKKVAWQEQQRKRREEEKRQHKAAIAKMQAEIPAEWSPIRSTLKSPRMRSGAKMKLMRSLLSHTDKWARPICKMPKLSINQQHHIVEEDFACHSHKCDNHRDELSRILAVCVDPGAVDSLVTWELAKDK